MNIDISDFRLPRDPPDFHYMFMVIIDTPKIDFNYEHESWWLRLRKRLLGLRTPYTYFRKGQLIVADETLREIGWGGKPGKHDCTVRRFTDLAEAIQCVEDVVNGYITS